MTITDSPGAPRVSAREAAAPVPAAERAPDVTADIIVVGGGGGGLPAALFSRWLGNEVVLLEKAPELGGTASKAAFWYWVPNNEPMRAAGLADPEDGFLRYVARLSRPTRYDPDGPTLGVSEYEYAMYKAIYESAAPPNCSTPAARCPTGTCPRRATTSRRSPRTPRLGAGCSSTATPRSRCPTAGGTASRAWPPPRPATGWTSACRTGCSAPSWTAGGRRRGGHHARRRAAAGRRPQGGHLRLGRIHPRSRASPQLPECPRVRGLCRADQRGRLRAHRLLARRAAAQHELRLDVSRPAPSPRSG
jgi:hypothetical protein